MPALPGSIPLFTRLRREVPNRQILDYPPGYEARARAELRQYSQALERRPATGVYNCHGMTFANRRTCVFDDADVKLFLSDDGYRRIRASEVQVGDIAVYSDAGEITHSGIVVAVIEGYPEGTGLRGFDIISKWGTAGEYRHRANEGPYRSHDLTFWTDRP